MSFFRVLWLPAMLAVLFGVSGCASVPSSLQGAARAAPFDVLGRVLVSYDGRAFTANVRWLHASDTDEIWLMTPAGQVLAHLREAADGAMITTADQTQHRAASVESLTKRALGWELPAGRLQHWLRGTPVPGTDADIAERDAAGRIRRLTQDGWRITYDYYPPSENEGLPRRMDLVGAAQTLRLVIDTWRRDAADTPAAPM